ncbi:MAG: C_GCAxxG_C_C family protein [Anaerolineales bacterium]|nr:C_GCAxxG_C_C family protein [Anaerolineales bacterium]
MDRSDQAAEHMRGGWNCAQSVVKAFSAELGVEEEAVVRMAASFGGGMARNGYVCGAVSGAAIVLGARCGFSDPADTEARTKNVAKVNALIEKFQKENGAVLCRELLSIDPKNPEDWKRVGEAGAFANKCPLFVQSAAKILEEILAEK